MISLSARASDLAARSTVARIPLVHLTTYSDHEAGTVSAEYWWSNRRVRYEWAGGAARDFDAVLLSISPVSYGITHVPGRETSDLQRSQVSVVLAQYGVDVLWESLGLETLQFARVEIADLLVEPERMAVGSGSTWWDFTDYAGTEHVVRFRGEFSEVSENGVSDEGVELIFRATEPNLALPEADAVGEVDPRDLGVRYAMPFGGARSVRCVNRSLGWVTTLAEEIDATATGTKKVTDASGFPIAGPFRLQLGAERVTAEKVDDQNVSISARAQGGTTATAHRIGESAAEVRSSVVLVAAGLECKSLTHLYVVNPETGERVRVTTPYSVNLADDATDLGRRLTTVTFTQAQYEQLLDSLASQETAQGAGVETLDLTINALSQSTEAASDSDVAPSLNGWAQLLGHATDNDSFVYTLDAAAIPPGMGSRIVRRWRIVLNVHGQGGGANKPTLLDIRAIFFGATQLSTGIGSFNAGTEYGKVLASAWETPAGGTIVDDAATGTVEAWLDETGTGNWTSYNAVAFTENPILQMELESDQQVAIPARAAGDLRLQFEADVDGAFVPFTYVDGYAWADGDFWNVDGMTHADVGDDQQFTVEAASFIADGATVLGDCEDVTEWNVNAGTWADDAVVFSQGSKSMKGTPQSNAQQPRIQYNWAGAGIDWSDYLIAVDLRPNGTNHLTLTDGVQVTIDSGSFTNNFVRWKLGSLDLTVGQFTTIFLNLDTLEGVDESEGTLDVTGIEHIWFACNHGTNQSTAHTLNVDNIRLLRKQSVAQRDVPASPTIDLTAYLNRYRLRLKATNADQIDEVRVGFSNTDVSGVTKPANLRELVVSGNLLPEATSIDALLTAIDTGTPSYNAVRCLRVEVKLKPNPVPPMPVVTIEDLDVATSTGLWGMTSGASIEEGPDVIRYFLEILCGLTVESSSFSTAKTNLGGAIFSGRYEALGATFAEILAGLEHETRTNIVRVEKASGTEYRALNAARSGTSYTFPASVATLSQLRELRESVRPASECPTRFLVHHHPRPGEVQRSEDSFLELLRAGPLVNDFTAAVPTATIAAAELVLGRRDAEPFYLIVSDDSDAAIDVAGYYIADALRRSSRRWTVTVPLFDGNGAGYALEVGEVVAFTPRWRASAAKARVTQVSHQLNEPMVGLVLEEVA